MLSTFIVAAPWVMETPKFTAFNKISDKIKFLDLSRQNKSP